MKKKGLLKGIVLSAACLLGFGTLIGATTDLFQNKTYETAEAATETKATLTKDNIIAASSSESSEATINGITFDWGDTEFTVSGSTLRVDADHAANILVASSGLSSNNVTHVSVNISYTAAALNTTLQIIEGFTNKLVNISLTGTSYSSGDVSIDNSKMLMIKIMNNGNDDLNNLTISSFSLDLKGIPAKSAVTIAKGTGVKSVYLSTSNTATSGSASGTKYDYGTTVYGFAELAKGYNAASGWTLVSGTANTEGAKYRVGSVSAGSSNFGTVNASLASYTISYNLNGGALPSGKTNPSSYNVNSNNITLNNPTRTGYTFKGWSGTGLTGDTNKSVTISKGSIGNRSYTANWNLYNYIINYNLDGGHETVSNPINYTIETNTFTLNNPGRDGRDFVGWTGSNGSNPQTTVTIAKGSTGDKSYLANWALTAEVQAVYDKINAIGTPSSYYPGSKAAISDAKDAIDALQVAYPGWDWSNIGTIIPNYGNYLSAEAAYDSERETDIGDAITAIDALPSDTSSISYPEDRDLVFTALNNYNALSQEDKENEISVERLHLLNQCVAVYNEAKDNTVAAVIEAIDAIGTVSYPDSASAIEAAEDLYSTLHQDEKDSGAVTNYATLTTARSEYNSQRDVTVAGVISDIEAIPNPLVYPDSLVVIETAEASFNALDETEQDSGAVTNKDDLVGARAAYDTIVLIEKIKDATTSTQYEEYYEAAQSAFDALTPEQKAFIPNSFKDDLNDASDISAVMSLIDAIGDLTYNAGTNDSLADIEAAEEAYNALTPEQQAVVDNFNHSVLINDRESYDKVDDAVNLINSIGDVTHGGASDSKEAIDAAREAYDNLTPEEKALVDAYGNTKKVLEDDEKVYEAMRLIDEIGNLELTDECGERIDAAKDYFDSLTADQIAVLTSKGYAKEFEDKDAAYDTMVKIDAMNWATDSKDFKELCEAAEATYGALTADQEALIPDDFKDALADDKAANEAMILIDAIGDLSYNGGTNDSLIAIQVAEEAYNALTPEQKALVHNYNHDTLVEDRASYDKVDATIRLINSIGDVSCGGDNDSKAAIDAARTAYDNLTPEEKALVDAYGNTKKVLEDDEKVYETMEVINKVGEVSYDTETEEALEEARVAYEALTEDQKAQLGEKYLDKLTRSEEKYQGLQKGSNITVIILLVLVSLINVGGGLFLFLVLKKKNKGSVKAMSVSGFLPFMIFASHYADTPWIVVYILAGVAVLVWAAGLAFFIMKKKQIGPFKKKEEPVTNEMNKEEAKVEEAMKEEQVLASTQNADVSSNEDEEEVVTVTDEKGNIFQIRFIKSFTAKLIQSPEETKMYYEELKNEVLSYKNTNGRISWHYDSINSGRNPVLKFAVRGKTLCVYFPLNADDYADSKYKVEKVESKKFSDVPCLYRIKNDRRLGYAKDLIAEVAKKLGLEKGEEQHEIYSNLPYEETQALIERGLIKELKTKVEKPIEQHHGTISVSEADEEMSDEAAEAKIEEDKTSKKHEGKKGVINIDTIGENFNDGDLVNLEALWAKKLVPNNVGYVKVLARGTLNKRLNVDLQDYSIQAVKMILLEGGTVKKAK